MEDPKLEELLTCPVCRDIFRDPRQLPCGHSMCLSCLEDVMAHSEDAPCRCPDCRADFEPIIGVHKSYALANIVEDFKANRRRREKQRQSVYCDCCLEERAPATRTCLRCEVSLCAEHVKEHLELPVFTGHPLVGPLGDLLERKCPQHEDEVLRYYCNTSRRYICNICALESSRTRQASEACGVLRRQLTEYMDQRFHALKEQIGESIDSVKKLEADLKREKRTAIPVVSPLNSVTVVLFCLWLIVLYYAYNYSVEIQTLTEALEEQQNRVHHIYSTIVELLVNHPIKSHTPPETEDPETKYDLLKLWNGKLS